MSPPPASAKHASNPSVYGLAGVSSTCAVVPLSITSPAYITTTWSQSAPTTARSCEISISVASSRSTTSAIRSSTCTWMVRSSPVVGSSAISSFGEQTSAIAIITRCAMPPENWCG